MTVFATDNAIDTSKLPDYSLSYNPDRDPFKDGHAAIALASKTNRRILIEVGGSWCNWCHIMDQFLTDNPDIQTRLHQAFVVLKINVSDKNDNSKFLSSFPRPLGYPHMYVAEMNGDVLLSKDTADFLVNGRYSKQKFLEFIEHWTLIKG
ncbi:MAG: DUF255 domain-containing protein [Gammaproteobacteria bacterium]|nr:DUF255 domain-containing protein [Gammaproteobacteria bacterium]